MRSKTFHRCVANVVKGRKLSPIKQQNARNYLKATGGTIRLLELFIGNETWYDHSPDAVMKNNQVKLLWDFRIQTDHHLHHNRPEIVVLEKAGRVCRLSSIRHVLLIRPGLRKLTERRSNSTRT